MREQDDFEPRETVAEGRLPRDLVRLYERDGLLHVELLPSPMGWPWRRWRPTNMRLAPGETLRWQINYRFSGYHGWSYRLDTLNLAYGPAFPEDAFLTAPTHFVNERAHLY